jgi:type VI secretion system secreted protein Hcp
MSTVPAAKPGIESPHSFLKIAEIKGESRSKNHEDEIELTSWSWGETQSVFPSESRKSGGSVSMRDLQFTAKTSAASAQFLLHCASAKRFKSAILTCAHDYKGGQHTYLTITLSNVVIGSYDIEGSHTDDQPVDRVTLKFTKIEFAYVPLKPDGTPGSSFTCSWDLAMNTA